MSAWYEVYHEASGLGRNYPVFTENLGGGIAEELYANSLDIGKQSRYDKRS
jgi:hypothetical protein